MLPTAVARMPAPRSRSRVKVVVVVLPLVPVMATQRSGDSRQANSGSDTISAEHACAARKKSENSEMPGDVTQRS